MSQPSILHKDMMMASTALKIPCTSGFSKFNFICSSNSAAMDEGSRPRIVSVKTRAIDAGNLQENANQGIFCEPCGGRGWLVCDFCQGQKINVKADNKRIYRRCPSCRAIGYILCSNCKVFKCVTFPNPNDCW